MNHFEHRSVSARDAIALLREEAKAVRPYPVGLMSEGMSEPLPHTLWFPFGRGVEHPEQPFPRHGAMVLGQDWGTTKHLDEDRGRAAAGYEFSWQAYPTTRRIRALLADVALDPHLCFFTNAFLGVRLAGVEPTGPCPGWKDAGFTARCRQFLVRQIEVQRPAVILALGKEVARFVANLSSDLEAWRSAGTFRNIDDGGPNQTGAVRRATFHDANHVAVVVALTHPSLPNTRWRSYKGQSERAEQRMLRDALASASASPIT